MNIKKWNGKFKSMKKFSLDMIKNKNNIIISSKEALKNVEPFDWNNKDTILTEEGVDTLISQIEKAKVSSKRTSKIDIEDNIKEGRRLLENLLSKRQK